MPGGGANPGERRGGRKPNAKNKATIEREARAAEGMQAALETGLLPLDVMLRVMRGGPEAEAITDRQYEAAKPRSPAAIVGSLRRSIALLAESGDHDVLVVAESLRLWLDCGGADLGFDTALGLRPGWRSKYRRGVRDALLCELAERHFPRFRGRELARAITSAARRYETRGWPRDRQAAQRPDGLDGALFDVLALGEMPGFARLRQLFDGVPANPVSLRLADRSADTEAEGSNRGGIQTQADGRFRGSCGSAHRRDPADVR